MKWLYQSVLRQDVIFDLLFGYLSPKIPENLQSSHAQFWTPHALRWCSGRPFLPSKTCIRASLCTSLRQPRSCSLGECGWVCRVLTIVEIDLLKTAPKACSRSTHALPGMIETAPCHRSLSRHFHANAPPHEADDNWLRPYSQSSQPQVCASPVGRLSVVSTIRALQTPSIKPSHAPMRHAFSTWTHLSPAITQSNRKSVLAVQCSSYPRSVVILQARDWAAPLLRRITSTIPWRRPASKGQESELSVFT